MQLTKIIKIFTAGKINAEPDPMQNDRMFISASTTIVSFAADSEYKIFQDSMEIETGNGTLIRLFKDVNTIQISS